jgi:hypothetical protein
VRIYLPRFGDRPFVDVPVAGFEDVAAQDRFGEHRLVAEPDDADLILFTQCHMVDWRLEAIREHAVARAYWMKVMVYDERDRPWHSLPGVYVSMPRRSFDQRSQRSWGYFHVPDVSAASEQPDILYSFVGSMSHACRRPLLELRHPEGLVEEVPSFFVWQTGRPDFETRRNRFKAILARSRFVLCPRGRGTSSYRIYETLAAGRVPVIISDEWVPPRGPNWELISIRWPEYRLAGLTAMLEERDGDWPALSAAVRGAHRDFFAPEVSFHRIAECCADLAPVSAPRRRGRSTFRLRALAAAAGDHVRRKGILLSSRHWD